jgi:hypothetical protein
MHFHMEATLMWSMPLDHSTHEVVGKNWPDLSKSTIESKNPRCLCILYFANAYAHFMTLICDKETRFFKATTPYLTCFNLRTFFFLYINITFNKLKMRFSWIFSNNYPTCLKQRLLFKNLAMINWPLEASLSPCQCNF